MFYKIKTWSEAPFLLKFLYTGRPSNTLALVPPGKPRHIIVIVIVVV